MADVRALLAKEREARRIQHPHLSYSKSGALTCTVCNLNVKSETLWEGHLKSPNHRKNLREVVLSTNDAGNGKKRKIEEVMQEENPRKRKTAEEDLEQPEDARKKRQVSFQTDEPEIATLPAEPKEIDADVLPGFVRPEATIPTPAPAASPDPPPPLPAVNEDEWAAFEAEVAPLAREQDFSAATISAAPVSASELVAQQAAEARRSRKDLEAEDEKEEEEQRMVEEFEVMEEMEERVRRLKERREALRRIPAEPVAAEVVVEEESPKRKKPPEDDDEDEGSGDEVDDWYS